MSTYENSQNGSKTIPDVQKNIGTIKHKFEQKDKWSLLCLPHYNNHNNIIFKTDHILVPKDFAFFDTLDEPALQGYKRHIRIPLQSIHDGSTSVKTLLNGITEQLYSVMKTRMDSGDDQDPGKSPKGYQCSPLIKNDRMFDVEKEEVHKHDYCVFKLPSDFRYCITILDKDGAKMFPTNTVADLDQKIKKATQLRFVAMVTSFWIKKGKEINKFGSSVEIRAMEICM